MAATNTNVVAVEVAPLAGATNSGYKVGFIDSAAKAAQNDTLTVTNADAIAWAGISNDGAGTFDAVTIATNVITLTGATTGACSGLIFYKAKQEEQKKMAAAEITETAVGGLVGSAAVSGSGLHLGIYTATKVTQNDWIIFGDFSEIKECVCYTVSTGARTAEAFTVDGTTKNKVTFTSATTGSLSVVVIGTKA